MVRRLRSHASRGQVTYDTCRGALHLDAPPRGNCPYCVAAHNVTREAAGKSAEDRAPADGARRPRDNRAPEHSDGQRRSFATFHKAARQTRAAKGATHCHRGHEFTPENTRVGKRNNRSCKECHRINEAARHPAARPRPRLPAPSSPAWAPGWPRKLKEGARRMHDVLVAAYPAALLRYELAQRSGVRIESSYFDSNLSALRLNGLVDGERGGPVRARHAEQETGT